MIGGGQIFDVVKRMEENRALLKSKKPVSLKIRKNDLPKALKFASPHAGVFALRQGLFVLSPS